MGHPTFKEFDRFIEKYGISSSNLYDIEFKTITNGSRTALYDKLRKPYSNDQEGYKPAETLRFYTDELSLPGEQVVSSNYKINNSPAYSYATDVIYPEITITFILDAFMNQKKIFEKWIDFIKPMSIDSGGKNMMRLRYRDEYVSDITINKYERYGNGWRLGDVKVPISINPGIPSATSVNSLLKYSVVLHNAHPTSISTVQLNSGSSQLNRVSVGFKYEYPIYSSNNNMGTPPSLENVV